MTIVSFVFKYTYRLKNLDRDRDRDEETTIQNQYIYIRKCINMFALYKCICVQIVRTIGAIVKPLKVV